MSPLSIDEMKELACLRVEKARGRILAWDGRLRSCGEPAFCERDTARFVAAVLASFDLPVEQGIALTGCRVRLNPWERRPRIGLLTALDGRPDDLRASRISGMLATLLALADPKILNGLYGGVDLIAYPAGTFEAVADRDALAGEGKIRYDRGIAELVRLDIFDSIDIAMGFCPPAFGDGRAVADLRTNGFLYKQIRFCRPTTAQDDAGLLNAIALSVTNLNALHGLFDESAHLRFRPTLGRRQPGELEMELRVYASDPQVLSEAGKRVDAALKAAAETVGVTVEIATRPGFLPFRGSPRLAALFLQNAGGAGFPGQPAGMGFCDGASDLGDLSGFLPSLLPLMGWGDGHPGDAANFDRSVLSPAKALAMTVIDLLSDKAYEAENVIESFRPRYGQEEYLRYLGGKEPSPLPALCVDKDR